MSDHTFFPATATPLSPPTHHNPLIPSPKPHHLTALDGHLAHHEVTIRAIVHLKDQERQALARGDVAVAALFREVHRQKEQPIYDEVTATFPKDDLGLMVMFKENADYYGYHGMRELERGYLAATKKLEEKVRASLGLFWAYGVHQNDQYQAPLDPHLPLLGSQDALLHQQHFSPMLQKEYQFINFTKPDFQTDHHHTYFDREGNWEIVAAQAQQDGDHDSELAGFLDFVVKVDEKKDADDEEDGFEVADSTAGDWTTAEWL